MKLTLIFSLIFCFDCIANTCEIGSASFQPQIEKFAQEFINFSNNQCALFDDEKSFDHFQKGLSDFWAQEYTGSDLLRKMLIDKEITAQDGSKLFELLDTPSGDHGTNASNLIAGPSLTSLIPAKESSKFVDVQNHGSYSGYYSRAKVEGFPAYISNSMTWPHNGMEARVIGWISNNSKTLIVTAAGNLGYVLDPNKIEAADNLNVLVIGSAAPSGEPSDFSQYSDRVVISAPSDNYIASVNKKKEFSIFGGTSGATPQVTAALAAFTLITGHKLNKSEAIQLLKSTAQKGSKSFDGKHGAGILNTYKIGRIAFKLQEYCKNFVGEEKTSCIVQKISQSETYNFEPQDLSAARKAFAGCFPLESQSEASCTQRQAYFKLLREEALLNPRKDVLESLACIAKSQGYNQNALFYQSLVPASAQ